MARITPQQSYNQLRNMIVKRDRVVARNNALATRDPAFAARLRAARATSLDVHADRAVADAHVAMQPQQAGMGYAGLVVGGVAAVVLSVLAIAGTYVFLQIWREEREFAQANPVQASIESGTKAVWAVFAVGLIALGGLVYWDYRKNQPALPAYSGGRPPFELRSGPEPATRHTDMRGKLGADVRQMKQEAKQLGQSAKQATLWSKKTEVDPHLEERMEEERGIWEAAHQAELADRRRSTFDRGYRRW